MKLFALEEFAARRRKAQDEAAEHLRDAVIAAMSGDWNDDLTEAVWEVWSRLYFDEAGDEPRMSDRRFTKLVTALADSFTHVNEQSDSRATALAIANATIAAATYAAAEDDDEDLLMEWVTMADGAVRETHADTHGQVRPIGEPFDVGGFEMPYPGWVGAPVELWINCRCTPRPVLASEFTLTAAVVLDEPTHAGIAVVARDTGRVLLLQRALDPTDPPEVQGTWEFPGGSLEETDESVEAGAWREFCEETALPRPEGETVNGWRSPDGVYQGFVFAVPVEADAFEVLNPEGTATPNPDDPGRETPEVTAWFTVEQMSNLGPALRPEVAKMDWSVLDLSEKEADMPDKILGLPPVTEEEVAAAETDFMRAFLSSVREQQQESLVASAGSTAVPWHGVWAPEGVWSGDRRRFGKGSLRHRDLPLPLTWQKVGDDGHKGYVTVGMATDLRMIDGQMHAAGVFLETVPETDEVIGLLSEFGRFGVSVDADETTFELDESEEGITFSDAQVCSACIVAIPAFKGAYVTLGTAPWMDDEEPEEPEMPSEAEVDEEEMIKPDAPDPEEEERTRVGTAPKYERVPAASDEDVALAAMTARLRIVPRPEDVPLVPEQLADVAPGRTEDGPGWLTNPVDTDRIRDYWVSGPGGAKIGWGTPGDFNRCRTLVAEYVKPQHINGYCANRHFDALGKWPGPKAHSGEAQPFAAETLGADDAPGPALSLVASGGFCAPSEWFVDPKFEVGDGRLVEQEDGSYACPLTVTDKGQVFGHIAAWTTCHVTNPDGFGICTTPPRSETDYAYFLLGATALDNDTVVATGKLTVGGGHANGKLGVQAAMEHYDSTSTAVADVTCGEDEFGIWVAGWVRPGVSKEMVTALQASPPSGDWRPVGRHPRELIAAHSVNAPGFPILRARVTTVDGRQTALVAAGYVTRADEVTEEMTTVDIAELARLVAAELEQKKMAREEMARLAAELEGA